MPNNLPYLPTYKNVAKLFEKISAAKIPDSFTHTFLASTLGMKSTGDRPLIPLLKTLKFLETSGTPTSAYSQLKTSSGASVAIAQAVRIAYEPLFAANQNANELSPKELRDLVSQVAGTDAPTTSKIAGTFSALVKISNFKTKAKEDDKKTTVEIVEPKSEDVASGLRPEFHYNFQIHLPSNATEETYLSIFNALRKVFK